MEDLKRIFSDFVQSVSDPVIKGILDDLWQQGVFSTEEKRSVIQDQRNTTDRARRMIEDVIGKGEPASQIMINSMKKRDKYLCITLRLIPSDSVAGSLLAGSQEVKASYKVSPTETQGRTSELIHSSEQFKTEKLKDRGNIYAVMAPATRTRMALLITNVHFAHGENRDGAEKDEQDMSKLLISLGYNVEQYKDLSGAEMDEAVRRFSKDPRLATTDSVFVVIMSDGVMGYILGVHHWSANPDLFPIDNIYKYLDSNHCGNLVDKPKVIIIQADRRGGGSVPGSVQNEKDLVSFLSCTPGMVSYRHRLKGSYFIQYIVDIFNRHAQEDHIDELFTKVLKRFEDEPPSPTKRQMPVKDRCTLTRRFYLFPENVDTPYPMKAQQRGFCLIVNNFDFSPSRSVLKLSDQMGTNIDEGLSDRMGTNIDEESLRRVFTWLGFKVEVLKDLTSYQMLDSMRELASRDHGGMDCVACVVLSHGREGGVYGVDGGVVLLKDLTDYLNGVRCASLRGKPKLFFIQACQGKQKEQAVPVQANRPARPEVSDQTDGPSSTGVRSQTDGPSSTGDLCSDAVFASELIPSTADFLTAMATTPSYVSVRLEEKGSWFIQSLCQNLVKLVPCHQELASILTTVNKDVSKKFDRIGGCRQMPQHANSLRFCVVFPVPEGPPPSLPTSP